MYLNSGDAACNVSTLKHIFIFYVRGENGVFEHHGVPDFDCTQADNKQQSCYCTAAAALIYWYASCGLGHSSDWRKLCFGAYLRGMPSAALAFSCRFCNALSADRVRSSSSVAPA